MDQKKKKSSKDNWKTEVEWMETKESPTLQLDSLRNQGEGQETEEETS